MKSSRSAAFVAAFSLLALGAAALVFGADQLHGSWTISPSKQAGMVQFGISYRDGEGHSHHQSDWPVRTLQGIDLATPGKHDVHFTISREAGRIDAEGFVEKGEGAGMFRFEPSAAFVPAMEKIGFGGIDQRMQFAMAIHDVTVEFARTMKAENLSGLDTDQLVAFRIFDVTPQFIRELRTEGLPAKSADTLIAFRVHEVTPEYVAKVKAQGLGEPTEDQLIAMRVHDVTPEYIAAMKSRGLKNLTLDRLVELKVHDIN